MMPSRLELSQLRTAQIRERLTRQGEGMWLALESYRDADIDRFVRLMVPKVQAAQIATATATAAYLGGGLLPREAITSVRNVDPFEEYRRPAVSLYTELSKGGSLDAGKASGAKRLADLLTMDLQLAKTTQSRASMTRGGFTYYRRVLSGSENCDLCSIASTQRYSVRELMPIHPGCDCGVETVSNGSRLGPIDSPSVELLAVHDHGEWGPTLAWASDHFTSAADIAA